MPTRREEFAKVRETLGYPCENRPTPHQIVGELLKLEQKQYNEIANTGQPVALDSVAVPLTTNSLYEIKPALSANFGKPLMVYRFSNGKIHPIPFTNIPFAVYDQRRELFVIDQQNELQTETVAFLRTPPDRVFMQILPAVETLQNQTLVIVFSIGYQNVNNLNPNDVSLLEEFSDYRVLQASLNLLPHCQWENLSFQENLAKINLLQVSLERQVSEHKRLYEDYIRTMHVDSVSTVSYWFY